MIAVKTEAIADANAYLNNVDLPLVEEMAASIDRLLAKARALYAIKEDAGTAASIAEAEEILKRLQ